MATKSGTAGPDTLNGGSGNDILNGLGGNDVLNGFQGRDHLDGGPGADTMNGGTGNDVYFVDDAGDTVNENSGEGVDAVRSTISYALGSNLENLNLDGASAIDGTGNTVANLIWGNDAANVLTGLGGDDYLRGFGGGDTLNGGDGNDRLDGGLGADSMTGGIGNDVFYVDDVGDSVTENPGEGTDVVHSTATFTLGSDVEYLNLDGNAAIDGTGNSLANLIWGNDTANVLSGMGGDDYLRGFGGGDTLNGGDGNDRLDGGIGADAMAGGIGDDLYYVDNAGDGVTENPGEGTDVVHSTVSFTLGTDVEYLNLDGNAAIDGTGNSLVNLIWGNDAANVLTGLGGDDVLRGYGGDDTLNGGTGNDRLNGGDGVDTAVFVGSVDDYTFGRAGGALTVTQTASGDLDKLIDFEHLQFDDASIDLTSNNTPIDHADSYTVDEDTLLTIPATGVLANDVDYDGNTLSAVLDTDVSNGTLSLNADGSFSYAPDADFNGSDSFTYHSNDGTADGNTVTVSLTVDPVNDSPVGTDDIGTADEDTGLTVTALNGVLSNDTDADGDSLSVSAVSGGTVGSAFSLASGAILTLNSDGSYTYDTNGKFETLRPGDTDTDSFTYTVSDGNGGTDTATATITINGANEAPSGSDDTYNGVTGNTPFSANAASGVLANDSDPDQPATGLSVTRVEGTDISSGAIAVTGGTVTMAADGSFTFNPTTGFTGPASFTYTLSDADGGTDTATATINVSGLVWYVDKDYAGANGPSDGSFLKPFTDVTSLNGAGGVGDVDSAGDTIFIYDRTGTDVTANVILENNQKLFGDGHAFVVNGITVGATSNNSTIDHSSAGVTLATGNVVDGINLNGTATAAVGIQDANGTVGTLTVTNTGISGQGQIIDIDQGGTLSVSLSSAASTGSSVSNGGVIDLTGVTGTFTVTGTTTINGTQVQAGIDLTGNTSLTSSFNGLTTVNTGAQQAVNLGANTTSTTNFTAGLDIDTTSGVGLASTTGNTLAISGGTNTINTSTGQILNLSSTAIGASGVNFTTLGASGNVAATAINLSNVDGNSFNGGTVTINGTNGAPTRDGIFIGGGSTTNFSFAGATIGATADEGIEINGTGNGTVTFTTVSINGSSGNGVEINGSDNNVTISGGAIGNTDDPTGDAVNITGGTGAVSVAAAITKTTAGNVVEVNNHDAGNVTFSGNLSATGSVDSGILVTGSNGGTIAFTGQTIDISTGANAGVSLTSNTGGTINFAPAGGGNGLDIVTTSGAGFTATGGGTVSVTGAGNTIISTTGTALSIQNTTIGSSNVVFQSISANGGAKGISLNSTGSSGGLSVTGTGTTDGSGGTIQNISGRGIELINTNNVSLENMNLTNVGTGSAGGFLSVDGSNLNDNAAIHAANVVGLSLDNLHLNGGGVHGINGNNVTNFTLANSTVENFGDQVEESGIHIQNLLGTNSISNSTIQGNESRQLEVQNGQGSLDLLLITNSTFSNSSTPNGAQGVLFSTHGSSSFMKLVVTGSSFSNLRSTGIQTDSQGGSGAMEVTVTGSTFTNNGAAGIDIIQAFSSPVKFDVSSNTFLGMGSHVININQQTTSTAGVVLQGRIQGNTIGNTLSDTSGTTAGSGIRVRSLGEGTTTVLIDNNTVRGVTERGIFAELAESTSPNNTLNVTITNNFVNLTSSIADRGILVHAGIAGTGDDGIARVEISNNNATSAGVTGDGIRVREREAAEMQLPGYTGGLTDSAAVTAYLQARNPATTDTFSASAVPAGDVTAGFKNTTPAGSAVPLPSLPSSPLLAGGALQPADHSDSTTTNAESPDGNGMLTQAALEALVNAAIQLWVAAGATAEQVAAMRAATVSVAQLPSNYLASSETGQILIDDDAAGWGWFVDPTPRDNIEFSGSGTDLTALAGSPAVRHMDLLTAIMHELGHQAGLSDDYNSSAANVMDGTLNVGERHLPTSEQLEPPQNASPAHVQGWIARPVEHGSDEDLRTEDVATGTLRTLLQDLKAATFHAEMQSYHQHAAGLGVSYHDGVLSLIQPEAQIHSADLLIM